MVFMTVILTNCKQDQIKVIVPYGSPSYTTMYLDDTYDVSIVLGADPLVAAFGSKDYDVIIAPTNLGAKFYNINQTYQIVATIVWGNLYLVSKEEIDINALSDKTIYTFGQNQTPDIILNEILNSQNQNPTILYQSSASEVISLFKTNNDGVYLVAEPQLSILEQDQNINILDIQVLYQEMTGSHAYPQASVFIKNTLTDKEIENIQKDISHSMIDLINIDNAQEVSSELDIDISILSDVLSRSNIYYQDSTDIKTDIENYLTLVINQNPNLLDVIPDESFYR